MAPKSVDAGWCGRMPVTAQNTPGRADEGMRGVMRLVVQNDGCVISCVINFNSSHKPENPDKSSVSAVLQGESCVMDFMSKVNLSHKVFSLDVDIPTF